MPSLVTTPKEVGAPGRPPPPLPHITVEDAWRHALPKGTEIVAGRAGVGREVGWCAALRPRAPAFQSLRGGELVLVSTDRLEAVDAQLTLPRLLESLAPRGVAAAAVMGRISPEARARADALGLPLLLLPASAQLDEIEQSVLRYIVDRRTELHERTQGLHRELSELALAGRGLPALLARFSELIGAPVLLERSSGRAEYVETGRIRTLPADLNAAIASQRPGLEEWLSDVPLSAVDPPVIARPLPGRRARLIAPVLVRGSVQGFRSLLGGEGEMGELHRLTVGRAASACAIELVRTEAVREARDALDEDVLQAMTSGRPGSLEPAREMARRKGLDLEAAYLVVAGQAQAEGRAPRLRSAWERALAIRRLPALVRSRGEVVLGVIGLNARRPPELAALVSSLRDPPSPLGALAVGFGAPRSGLAQLAQATREAEQALAMGRRLRGPNALTAFTELGLYRLLAAQAESAELRAFHDEILAGLERRDPRGLLLHTLRAYLEGNASPTDAAARLHLHRNTVLYRLGRIEEITGIDLKDPDVRLTLHLALKIRDVLEIRPEAPDSR